MKQLHQSYYGGVAGAPGALAEQGKVEAEVRRYAYRLVNGVRGYPLDALIAQFAPEFPIEQMAIIDRNILRMWRSSGSAPSATNALCCGFLG